jgi:hypothetical protein
MLLTRLLDIIISSLSRHKRIFWLQSIGARAQGSSAVLAVQSYPVITGFGGHLLEPADAAEYGLKALSFDFPDCN